MIFEEWIEHAWSLGASDLHLETGTPLVARVRGDLQTVGGVVSGDILVQAAQDFLAAEGWASFRERGSADISMAIGGVRCRINFYQTVRGIAVAVRLESRGPALFRQTRTGLNGKEFEILKFRSMYVDAEKAGPRWASARDPRVTKVGRLLRVLRLDELPQLINVINGEMSFIGPRPERPVFIRELEKKIPFYDLRQLVRPGITGWAQVMYAYGASMDAALEKLQYDLYYIKNYSLLLDFAILLKTLRVVVLGRGR